MKSVLFICVHNSARSQMAEAFLKKYGDRLFSVKSAGLEKGVLNPLVVKAMAEIGIDISKNKTKTVFEVFKDNNTFDYIITVCDKKAAESCPLWPAMIKTPVKYIHWNFTDPSSFEGTKEEKLAKIHIVRDSIEEKIKEFVTNLQNSQL
jgi:arsenate reductase